MIPPEAGLTLKLDIDADPALLKRRSVHGAALTLLAQGVRAASQFSSQIILAHLLAPSVFGVIAMVAPVLSFVQIFNELGLTQATVQRERITHDELSALFWVNVGVSSCLALLMALAAPLVARFYHQPELMMVTICSASLLVLSGISAQQIALLNRLMHYGSLATIDVACSVFAAITGIVSAALGLGYWSLVLMQAANSLTITVLAWLLSHWRPSIRRWSGANIADLLRFGGHLTGSNILGYAEVNLPNVLLGRLFGQFALGLYDRAMKLVIVPWWQISLPISRVAVVLLSRVRGSDRLYVRAYDQMLQALLLAAVPGLLWASMEADRVVPFVLGRDWREAAPMVSYLSLATTLVPFGASAYWLFVSQGRVAAQLRWGFVSGGLTILSIVIGVPWGPVGIARSFACFAILVQGAGVWGATRSGPVNLARVFRASYPLCIGAAGSVVAMRAVDSALTSLSGTHATIFASLIVSYGACGVCLLCFPAGVRILRDVWELRLTLLSAPNPQVVQGVIPP